MRRGNFGNLLSRADILCILNSLVSRNSECLLRVLCSVPDHVSLKMLGFQSFKSALFLSHHTLKFARVVAYSGVNSL